MSNRIDFFQPVENTLALPAATILVLLDGSLCPYLEPIEIVYSEYPEFGWAKLAYNPAAYAGGGLISIEDIEAELAIGKSICIRQIYNNSAPDVLICSVPIFTGKIESVETSIGADGEKVEVTAMDFSASLKRITVCGRRVRCEDGSSVFVENLDTIFNEDGEGNAAVESAENQGNSYTVFAEESSARKFWSCAEATEYLLCEYLTAGDLQRPAIEQLQSLTENRIVSNLDVTGMSLLEALHHCCEEAGIKFKFAARFMQGAAGEAIVFYKGGAGRIVELNCQRAGQRFSISKTNVSKLSVRKSFNEASGVTATIDLETPYLFFDYRVGDRVTSGADGRDVLGTRRDNKGICRIERVRLDFKNQCTNLRIVRQRDVGL